MKKVFVLAVFATAVAVASAAALGSNNSQARTSSLATTTVTCGKTRTIGVAYPATGPAASLGVQQYHWAAYGAKQWNKKHSTKIRLIQGDTQLPDTAKALAVAHQFSSNSKILGLTGPAGSQEVQDTTAVFKQGGLAAVSGSATRVALTRAKTGKPRETSKGFFFRTVPNDDQQGARVAFWITKKLKKSRIYIIDDQESYSTGLADQAEKLLKNAGKSVKRDSVSQTVSDFSSLITRISSNTQIVFLPWQLAGKAQLFFTQLRAAGKTAIVFGSDGTFAPGTFKGNGSYVSAFPVDFTSAALKAFKKAHGGDEEAFGLPSYTSVWVNATAINRACLAGHGKTTRMAVRKLLPTTTLSKADSLLGFPVQFLTKNKGAAQGPGDMGGAADFAIFHIEKGKYVRVG